MDSIKADDPVYGHLTNRERRYVTVLQRRASHLSARIEAAVVRDLSYDKHELAAIQWVLGIAALSSGGRDGNV